MNTNDIDGVAEPAADEHGLLPCAYCGAPAVRNGKTVRCSRCSAYSITCGHPTEAWNLHMAKVALRRRLAGKPKTIEVRVKVESREEYNPLNVTIISNTFEHPYAPRMAVRDEYDD